MKFFNFLIIIFISLTSSIKADLNKNLINQLEEGGKLIFIRHAYAPGSGDPNNFNLNDCSTQRNLSEEGKKQAKSIGKFFIKNKIEINNTLKSHIEDGVALTKFLYWYKFNKLKIKDIKAKIKHISFVKFIMQQIVKLNFLF